MPTIPAGLQPISSAYSFGGPGGAMRTEVDGGMARYALDWDRGVQRFNVTIICTSRLQFAVWTAFYYQTIKKGTISFDMPLDSGFGLSMHSCNIVPETYSVSGFDAGVVGSIAFTVEAESQAYQFDEASALSLQYLFEAYGEQYPALLARLAQFANVDTLVLNFA